MMNKLWYILVSMTVFMTIINASMSKNKLMVWINKTISYLIDAIEEDVFIRVLPDWIGSWSTDTKCDNSTCCCFFDYITTSAQDNGTKLRLIGQAYGIGVCAFKPIVFATIDMPKDFTLPFHLLEYPVNLSLSQDNQVISIINSAGSQCNTIAVRLKSKATRAKGLLIVTLLSSFVGIKNIF